MLGDLIGAGASLLGGFFGRKQSEENNERNIALQREFAQNGVTWKVQDALRAGIHPLAALGAQTHSFAPQSLGDSGFGNMGQDIGRVVKAAMSKEDREEEDVRRVRQLAIEKGGLENDVLRTQLASMQKRDQVQLPPAMPSNLSVMSRVPLPRPGPDRTISSGAAVKDDDIKQKEEDYPATKIVRPFGYPVYANPWFNDGQQFEDRYGDSELGSSIKFGVNTVADHVYTAIRRDRERGRDFWDRIPHYRAYKRLRGGG